MAYTTTLGFEEGCPILSYDGANAFNNVYRRRFLPALAEIVPSVVPYATNLYARETPKLLFALNGAGLESDLSPRGKYSKDATWGSVLQFRLTQNTERVQG